jgi:hypothetical protein
MKRAIVFGFLALVSLSFVSAYYGGGYWGDPISGFGRGVEQLIDLTENTLGPFFAVILGGEWDFLFEKVLFLAIMLAVVYVITSKMDVFKDNKWVIWIVTIAVSVLSTRFLTETELVKTMLLPYTTLGVAISAVLPLIIYFTFVQKFSDSPTMRKLLWIFFIVTFVGIWASRYDDLGDLSWIYFFTAAAALIFLLADGTIRRAINNQKFGEMDADRRIKMAAELSKDLKKLEEDYAAELYPEGTYLRMKKRLTHQIESLRKH